MYRFMLVAAALLGGCAAYTPHPPADIQGRIQVYKDEVSYVGASYLISPGDELEIIYHLNVEVQDQYKLAVGDQIRVEFFNYPQLDRTLDVRPDGKVTIPYEGDIMAANLSPKELASNIDRAYVDLLKRPQSTVTLIRYGQRIRELKEAIKTAGRGQSRLAVVAPDGRASLPLVAPVAVAGKTVDQVERLVGDAYQKIIPGLATSTILLAAKGNIVYIFGAVAKPGFYELKGPITTLQGVAMAGGFTPNAEASSVLLISRDEENHAVGRLIDHAAILSKGNIAHDTLLRQADVVFVPNTKISEAVLIADFIRRLIPVNLGLTYGFTQQVLPAARVPQAFIVP
jgi:protein involved in polysaccharide export with SLBB domain